VPANRRIQGSCTAEGDILFTISTHSFIQRMVPNHLPGRTITVIRVFTWSTASVRAILGGLAIARTAAAALVHGAVGVCVWVSSALFWRTPPGRTPHYAAV